MGRADAGRMQTTAENAKQWKRSVVFHTQSLWGDEPGEGAKETEARGEARARGASVCLSVRPGHTHTKKNGAI